MVNNARSALFLAASLQPNQSTKFFVVPNGYTAVIKQITYWSSGSADTTAYVTVYHADGVTAYRLSVTVVKAGFDFTASHWEVVPGGAGFIGTIVGAPGTVAISGMLVASSQYVPPLFGPSALGSGQVLPAGAWPI